MFLKHLQTEEDYYNSVFINCILKYFSSKELDNLTRIESIVIIDKMLDCVIEMNY